MFGHIKNSLKYRLKHAIKNKNIFLVNIQNNLNVLIFVNISKIISYSYNIIYFIYLFCFALVNMLKPISTITSSNKIKWTVRSELICEADLLLIFYFHLIRNRIIYLY